MEAKGNITQDKSYAFALKIVKLYKQLAVVNKEFVLSKQVLKSGTSIGANVAEANGAISNADFSSKISIAYLIKKRWKQSISSVCCVTESLSVIDNLNRCLQIVMNYVKSSLVY